MKNKATNGRPYDVEKDFVFNKTYKKTSTT